MRQSPFRRSVVPGLVVGLALSAGAARPETPPSNDKINKKIE
jgi:hypothetical protein